MMLPDKEKPIFRMLVLHEFYFSAYSKLSYQTC